MSKVKYALLASELNKFWTLLLGNSNIDLRVRADSRLNLNFLQFLLDGSIPKWLHYELSYYDYNGWRVMLDCENEDGMSHIQGTFEGFANKYDYNLSLNERVYRL